MLSVLLMYVSARPMGAYAAIVSLPKTGQITCYNASGAPMFSCANTGQDGDKLKGMAWPSPRFTNQDGTIPISGNVVVDQLTGLMWTKNANLPASTKKWQDALDYIAAMNSANGGSGSLGFNDWRLPNRKELTSLINLQVTDSADWLNGRGFSNVIGSVYWSSSSYMSNAASAWAVLMYGSYVLNIDKSNSIYVWPVRSGQLGSLDLTPTSKDFGSVATNATSAPQVFNINNKGSSNLVINGMTTIGGDTTLFTVNPGDGTGGTCGSLTPTIAPGNYCTISVTFTPTSNGNKATTLRVSSNDPVTPTKDSALTGTGIVPTYIISTIVVGGNGTISCESPVIQGNNSICTIAPNTNYRLETFTDNGIDKMLLVSGYNYPIYNILADHAIIGTFAVKITPIIIWANPSDITYGTALSATQLNATSNVAGTSVYTPAIGTLLNAGTQTLSVTFTPTDMANYTAVTKEITINVTKANQTIIFPAIVTKKSGDPSFDPGATASSGLPVTYTSSDTSVAIISGGLVQIIGGGTATITASQAGNTNYNPAVNQAQTLTVTGQPSKNPAITINNPADGMTTSDASLNIVGNVNGLKNKDNITINITNNGTSTSYSVTPASPSGDFSKTVTLGNGENIIEIVAVNKWSTSTDRRTIILINP